MKKKTLIVLLSLLTVACAKKEVTNPGGGNNGGGNTGGGNNNGGGGGNTDGMVIRFENSTFNGSATVAYTDGSTATGSFLAGVLKVPFSAAKDKTLKSLTVQNQTPLLLGRTEGDSIVLNYNNGVLNFRSAVNGYTPVATYAELQLINTSPMQVGAKYELKADLDLMNEEWKSLGYASGEGFYGIFEGGRHKLKNLKQSASNNNGGGLFSYLNGSRGSCEVRNLTISSGSITSSQRNIGAFAALGSGGVVLTGCENYASVTSTYVGGFAGGFLGELGGTVSGGGTVYLKNSTNYGEVSAVTGTAGGLAGGALFSVGCVVDSCTNTGTVRGETVGGIVAGMPNGNNYFPVSNCVNKGNLVAKGIAGGIVGYGTAGITGCHNSGNISCSDGIEAGGIAGRCAAVINSYNEGALSVAILEGVNAPLIGGVAGSVISGAAIGKDYNTGSITVTITRTYNNDIVIGGVIGSFPSSTIASLSQCYNKGAITVSGNSPYRLIGGVIGSASWNHSLDYSFNAGTIISNAGTVGGLIGFASKGNPNVTSVFRCYWMDHASDNAVYPVGNWGATFPAGTDIKKFGASAWPSASEGWTTGNGTNNAFWKSLGGWNNGSPVYPKLFFED